jgi:hypothetical protein
MFAPGGSRITGTSSVNCASASVNPKVAAGGWRTPEQYKESAFYGPDEDFTQAVNEYQKRVDELYAAEARADKAEAALKADPNNAAKQQEFSDAVDALVVAGVAASKAEAKARETEGVPLVTPTKDAGATDAGSKDAGQRRDPNAENACIQIAEFVAKCNSNGWRTPECKRALDRATSCGDPMVTDPIPGLEASEQSGGKCQHPAADPETVKKAWIVHCESLVRTQPGVDPCAPLTVEGTLHHILLRPSQSGEKACGDPRALTEADKCLPSVTLTQFGERDMEAIIAEVQKKAGGPAFIVPQPRPPGDPRPGTGPDPGPK